MRALAISTVALAVAAAACDGTGTASEAPSRSVSPALESVPAEAPAPRIPVPVATPAPTPALRVAAFDLASNRFLAHLTHRGALVVPLGSPGAAKYTQGRWRSSWIMDQRVEGEACAMTSGVQGVLRVPLRAAACREGCVLRVRLHPFGSDQRVDITVNDTRLATGSLRSGWTVIERAIPAGAIIDGENRIRLHFRRSVPVGVHRSGAAIAWVAVGPAASEDPPPTAALVTPDGALDGGAFDGLEWYAVVPDAAVLEVTPVGGAPDSTFRVVVEPSAGGPEVRAEGPADGAPRVVDLGALAGDAVRLRLEASGPVRWATARLTVPEPKADVSSGPARNVIIWMVDTLRADRLRAYNPQSRVRTPNMDRLAREGVVFRWATVQGAYSIPSHASLLTGLHPEVHGHTTAETRIDRQVELLSETFAAAGFKTAAFLSNGYVSTKWGFKQGWGTYKNYIREELPAHTGNMLKDVLPWIAARKGDRLFMYLATVDPHVAYHWRDEYALEYDPEPYSGPVPRNISGHFLNRIQSGAQKLSARDRQRLEATYDGEVAYNDAQLGRLIAHLEELGVLDETLIVVTSDHGEEMFERGGVGHGQGLHEELISVPFLLWRKGGLPPRVVRGDVEIVDLAPTVVSLAGLGAVEAHQGDDLSADVFGARPDLPRPAFAQKGDLARSLKIGRWKYMLRGGDNDDLFDLDADPGESTDVKEQQPVAHRAVRDVMGFWLAHGERWSKRRWGLPSNHGPGFVEALGSP
ncbi:MAG: hypothetical protein AMXMBFR64_25700 [Myxococcales bacterium]